MKQKTARSFKKTIANTFGGLGYFFCFLQWFWVVMLYFSLIQSATLFVSPAADQPVIEHHSNLASLTLPGPVEVAILIVVSVGMLAVTLYALVKIPMSIAKTGKKAINKTTQAVVPIVIKHHHMPETKKSRTLLTVKVVLILKLILIIVPLIGTAATFLLDKPSLDYDIALIIGAWTAGFSVLAFAVQYALAGTFHVKLSELK